MASTGYYKICPKCWRKYGRHFYFCLDCSPRAKLDRDGAYPRDTYRTRWGVYTYGNRVYLNFCCSKKLPLERRLAICDTCRAKFRCLTQNEDN